MKLIFYNLSLLSFFRYIEGLRDNKQYLSNWSELADETHPEPPQTQLPASWLGDNNLGYENATDALWALRDHMLRDAVALSRFT